MEELLNKLIKKGWKPFGIKSDDMYFYCLSDNKIVISYYEFDTEGECNHEDKWCDLRQLTSRSSGLWQFVCENGMIAGYDTSEHYTNYRRFNKEDFTECRYLREYQYRIIESSLKNENELEDFLLNSIKLD